jgi:hypothetical protein
LRIDTLAIIKDWGGIGTRDIIGRERCKISHSVGVIEDNWIGCVGNCQCAGVGDIGEDSASWANSALTRRGIEDGVVGRTIDTATAIVVGSV